MRVALLAVLLFGLERVARVVVREHHAVALERDVAHGNGGRRGLEIGSVGESVDRHVLFGRNGALAVVKAARDRHGLARRDVAGVDEGAVFFNVKRDVEREAREAVRELARGRITLGDRDALVGIIAAFVDRHRVVGILERLVDFLGPGLVPGLFVGDGGGNRVLAGADGQCDVFCCCLNREGGERGQNGRDERLPGKAGGVAHCVFPLVDVHVRRVLGELRLKMPQRIPKAERSGNAFSAGAGGKLSRKGGKSL